MVITTFVDAHLYHDFLARRSVTSVLHFVKQTPINWFLKKQATVQTGTYGSEFVVAHIATDQIIDYN